MGTPAKSKRFRLDTSLFYIIAILLLGVNFLLYRFWEIESLKNVIRGVAAFFLVLCLIFEKKKIKRIEIVLLICAAYLIVINGDISANISFLLLCAIAPVKNDDAMFKKINIIQLILGALVVFLLATGLKANNIYNIGGRIRLMLGFNNVNAATGFFFSVLIIWLYTRKKMAWWHLIAAVVVVTVQYLLTNSRTPFFASIVYLGMYWLSRYARKKWFKRAYLWVVGIVLVLPFLNNILMAVFPQLNNLLSMRLSLAANYIHNNSIIHLLIGGSKEASVDNAYIILLYNAGIFFYAFFAYAVLISSEHYLKTRSRKELAFIMSVLVNGLMESPPMRAELLFSVVFWILILRPVISKKRIRKKKAVSALP